MFTILKRMVYPSINRLLLVMLMLLAPALLLLAQDVALILIIPPDWVNSHRQIYSLLVNVAISYLVSLLFYVIQVHIPQRAAEKKAFSVLRNKLNLLLENERFIQQASDLIAGGEMETASIIYTYPKPKKKRNEQYSQRIESIEQENIDRILECNYHLYNDILSSISFSTLDRTLIDLIHRLYIEERYNGMCSRKLIKENSKLHQSFNLDIHVVEDQETIKKAIHTLSDVYQLATGSFRDSRSGNDRGKNRDARSIAKLTEKRK